jgi:glycosyltransferase involved in cell wall biosynthesis
MATERMDGTGIVVVHDQVDVLGGTERIIHAILTRLPAAEVVALSFAGDRGTGPAPPWFDRTRLITSRGRRRHFLAPMYARRVGRVPLEGAKVVLSVTHAGWSLAATVPPGARHLCYSNGVPRALYAFTEEYLRDYPPALRPVVRSLVPALRASSRRLARRPDRTLANSAYSARELATAYGLESEVLHPPVRTSFFTPRPRTRRHVLAVARLVPHKRIEQLVDAFRGLDETLVVAGTGPWEERLRAAAPANVQIRGYVEESELLELYRDAYCLVSPAFEEFGLAMAEAQACGVPVIAPRAGGALEIVRDGVTGILLDRVGPGEIAAAVKSLRGRAANVDACRAAAVRFDEARFLDRFERIVGEELALATIAPPPVAIPRNAPRDLRRAPAAPR